MIKYGNLQFPVPTLKGSLNTGSPKGFSSKPDMTTRKLLF